MSWPRARHYCQQLTGPENPGNGDLMSIHSDREHQLLLTHQMSSYIFMIRNFWIGLNRRDNDGKLVFKKPSVAIRMIKMIADGNGLMEHQLITLSGKMGNQITWQEFKNVSLNLEEH